jgi:N-ethylmaleimide reductase
MGYAREEAELAIANDQLDAIAFGTAFLANPDLPERFRLGAALNEPDSSSFYTPGAKGYTDYPTLQQQAA